ncbi:MAG: GNAT family N-acetyltransferase, partial [Betaproteobacteria bacterium]
DAPFIVRLLNDPGWLRFIGDRGVRDEEDARAYLVRGPLAMYARNGFGLWRVARRDDGAPVGMCGLIKRDSLPDVDVGFAFLPAYRGRGYAAEAAAATLALASTRYRLSRVVAIVSPDNLRSIRLLEKLGMSREGSSPASDPADPTLLFALDLG